MANEDAKPAGRRPNFTIDEELALAEAIKNRQDILFGKFEGSTVSKSSKKTAWLEVVAEVNAVGGFNRSKEEIQTKNKNVKTTAKRIESDNRKEITKTGGGKARIKELTEPQKIILQTVPEACIGGIDGGIDLHESKLVLSTKTGKYQVDINLN